MLQVQVIDRGERSRFSDALDQHHRLRHDIYGSERRCTTLARADGRAIGPFDTPGAPCLRGIDPKAGVALGSRLVPKAPPYSLDDGGCCSSPRRNVIVISEKQVGLGHRSHPDMSASRARETFRCTYVMCG